jgi:drug/metabolite transporter (DMT)-like permease
VGVVVVVLLGAGEEISFANAKGPLIVLGSPVAWSLYNVMAKPLIAHHSPIAVSSAASLIGTLLLLPLLSGDSLDAASGLGVWDWLLVLYLGVACTLAAYVAWTMALQHLDASLAMAYLYAIPVFAVALGAVTLGEQVTIWLAVGTALVVGGVALAQMRRPALPRAQPAEATVPD